MGGRVRINFRTLFSLHGTVDRRTYLATGIGLMVVKYVAATFLHFAVGIVWTPWDYLIPLVSVKSAKVGTLPTWVGTTLILWTLPFIWIGVSMMMRRAVDAGRSPALCAAMFIPFLNYVVMLWLGFLPSVAVQPGKISPTHVEEGERYRSALIGAAGAIFVGLLAILISVYVLRTYGITLFLGAPFIQGMVAGWAFNRESIKPGSQTSGVVVLSVVLFGGAILLFALEGLFCLAMAFPIAVVVALLGGMIGREIAKRGGGAISFATALFVIPTGSVIDRAAAVAPTYEVVTSVDVAAAPATVWTHVVQFDEITARPAWYFRGGIAYPIRASIDGTGVGAIRRCEFSTGAFVEPITTWDEPRVLAFDVADQPPPLRELSIYSKVYAPHLDGYFRSSHGEFRLVPTASGTRLEGHTWYSVDMYPQAYWRSMSEVLLHRIHRRVLDQVKREAEADASRGVRAADE
jgi:uncharacterized membrane protein YhaH (DUF805 family)